MRESKDVLLPDLLSGLSTPTQNYTHTTGAVLAMKPEATVIGRSARWPLENNLNV